MALDAGKVSFFPGSCQDEKDRSALGENFRWRTDILSAAVIEYVIFQNRHVGRCPLIAGKNHGRNIPFKQNNKFIVFADVSSSIFSRGC